MTDTTPRLWGLASLIISVVSVVLMLRLWLGVEQPLSDSNDVQMFCEANVDHFVAENLARDIKAEPFKSGTPIEVPTGLFIQSVAFDNSSDVNLTGYIWQKYPLDFPFERGVTFPEQISSGSTILEQQYTRRIVHNDTLHTLVGWYFDVTVRQVFDYSKYPLEVLTVWLRIWPSDFDNDDKILLVPDFEAYQGHDDVKFGLDELLVNGEWIIDETFFSYHQVAYDTNFGFQGSVDFDHQEFYFNLVAQRKFMNAFIINLVPLLVVAILLFGAIMTISNKEVQSERFGFSTSGILGTCSALFFVVMLSHIQVRNLFPGSSLVYIEYFYLVMYGAILATAMNAYLFSLVNLRSLKLLQYRDNLVAKASFWPALLGILAVITFASLSERTGPAPEDSAQDNADFQDYLEMCDAAAASEG